MGAASCCASKSSQTEAEASGSLAAAVQVNTELEDALTKDKAISSAQPLTGRASGEDETAEAKVSSSAANAVIEAAPSTDTRKEEKVEPSIEPRRDAEESPATQGEMAPKSLFDGTFSCNGVTCGEIKDAVVLFGSGDTAELRETAAGIVEMKIEGTTHNGKLEGDQICWDNGDVWVRHREEIAEPVSFTKQVTEGLDGPASFNKQVTSEKPESGKLEKTVDNGKKHHEHNKKKSADQVKKTSAKRGANRDKKPKAAEPAIVEHTVKTPDGSPVILREKATVKSGSIGEVSNGDRVTIVQQAGGWVEIAHMGYMGWMQKRFLKGFESSTTKEEIPPEEEIPAKEEKQEKQMSTLENKWARGNPVVFFDITINGEDKGRVEMELFAKDVPKTVENFRCLCTGEMGKSSKSGKRLHYRKSMLHRVVPDFIIQGGDFVRANGMGGESIYGAKMPDENFNLKHTGKGILSMANAGPNTANSQFFICMKECPTLDGKHVVFGKVKKGLKVLDKIDELGDRNAPGGKPKQPVQIKECGQLI